jgi:hypothetical protein
MYPLYSHSFLTQLILSLRLSIQNLQLFQEERERERERERVIGRNRRKIEFSGKLQTLDLKWSLALSMDRRHIQRKGLLSI